MVLGGPLLLSFVYSKLYVTSYSVQQGDGVLEYLPWACMGGGGARVKYEHPWTEAFWQNRRVGLVHTRPESGRERELFGRLSVQVKSGTQ